MGSCWDSSAAVRLDSSSCNIRLAQKVLLAAFRPRGMSGGIIWGRQYCDWADSGDCNIWPERTILLSAFGPRGMSAGVIWVQHCCGRADSAPPLPCGGRCAFFALGLVCAPPWPSWRTGHLISSSCIIVRQLHCFASVESSLCCIWALGHDRWVHLGSAVLRLG